MDLSTLVEELERTALVVLPREAFDRLLPSLRIARTANTFLAGEIRLFETDAGPAVAEYPTDSDRAAVRLFESVAAAEAFIDDRLATYERMWDGCGCHIDYYTPPKTRSE